MVPDAYRQFPPLYVRIMCACRLAGRGGTGIPKGRTLARCGYM